MQRSFGSNRLLQPGVTGPEKSTPVTAKGPDISNLKVCRDLVVSREARIGFSR